MTQTRRSGANSVIVSSGSSAPSVKDEHRGEGGVPGAGEVVRVDAELGLGVRAERVVLGELPGHLQREVLAEPLLDVEPGELLELLLGLVPQLAPLLVQQRQLGVLLGAHRDVLAGGHAQRARRQPGHAGDQDRAAVAGRAGDAHHDARGRDDAVVGAEHAGAQPVEPVVEPAVVRLVLVRAGLEGETSSVRAGHGVMVAVVEGAASKASLGCAHAPAGSRCASA